MFTGISPYQICVLSILFVSMCSMLVIAVVVSSKYYGARYVSKQEQANLEINEQVRKFFRQAVMTEETQNKFKDFIKKEQ